MGAWSIVIGIVLILLSIQVFYSVGKAYKKLKNGELTNPSPFILYGLWTSGVVGLFIAVMGVMTFTFY
ncbi:hypothetical protein [Companilactobacillus sp. HBUAS56275]|jgi:hypothetical protein|uniref:Immunity protein n=1 Tax=Candidatus Companilactobacillus pullicola TaxID=2838523 RepID=A0A9D1ZM10_9LACO|nr:hypothetical protein [Candidatus Companilactobacillus pullicola]